MNTRITGFAKPITWLTGLSTGWGNGYAVIPEGHKFHGKHYDEIDVNVHGGLTFSSAADDNGNALIVISSTCVGIPNLS